MINSISSRERDDKYAILFCDHIWGEFNRKKLPKMMDDTNHPMFTMNNFDSHITKNHYSLPAKRTTDPIVTGTSVLGIQYQGGVLIASDIQACYGSLAMYKNIRRLTKAGEHSIVGASGEFSDFQAINRIIEDLIINDECKDDGHTISPNELHSYLTRVMYQRRNKMDPFYNTLVVAGYKHNKPFLGYIDRLGTSFEDKIVTTGFGIHLALPILRKGFRDDLTEEEARNLLITAMRVLFYRDARAINKIQIGKIDETGVSISDPFELDTTWNHAEKLIK